MFCPPPITTPFSQPPAGSKRSIPEGPQNVSQPPLRRNPGSPSLNPRTHCKVKLKDIVMDGLSNPKEVAALQWYNVAKYGKRYCEINWSSFGEFYRRRGKSTAEDLNIRNRFTRLPNGFIKQSYVTSQGYDVVYGHIDWEKEYEKQVPSTPSDKEELAKFCDDAVVKILLQIDPNIWKWKCFYVNAFLQQMCRTMGIEMTLDDRNNFKILLEAEITTEDKNLMTLEQLQSFMERFGPVKDTLKKVRAFVEDGAKDWFIGLAGSDAASDFFKEHAKIDGCYYLVRAVPVPIVGEFENTKYVFAVSLWTKSEIKHMRIFIKDKSVFCVPKSGANCDTPRPKFLERIKDILERIKDIHNAYEYNPIPIAQFADLKIVSNPQPQEKTYDENSSYFCLRADDPNPPASPSSDPPIPAVNLYSFEPEDLTEDFPFFNNDYYDE